MKKFIAIIFTACAFTSYAQITDINYSKEVASTTMRIWNDTAAENRFGKWSYDMGVILKGIEALWMNTGDVKYFNYIQKQMDYYVQEDGSIKTYKPDEYNIDHINNGKLLLTLYRVTLKEKYLKAAKLLRYQLQTHPRTNEGSFWHKKIYPYQVWLDGLYMGQPFYAEYALLAKEDTAFNDITDQFLRIEAQTRDKKTGLLYHGYDESRAMAWANKETGLSPHFWGRAMGWYATAIVDVLDYIPETHPKRKEVIGILQRLTDALEKQQDKATGLWYDIMNYDGPGKEKNYLEASASSQFVYAIAKGVRKKYLPKNKLAIAQKGYDGLIKKYIKLENGQYNLHGTVKVSGLGGKPFRDGSFEYYMSEPVIVNDPKGVGAFLLASTEMDLLKTLPKQSVKQRLIVMDNYFNKETRTDAWGNTIIHHYKWNERDNGGYNFVNYIFGKYGATTSLLNEAPNEKNLKNASAYFLIDPDWPKENKTPNYIDQKHITALVNYVKQGGVLVMMANDSNNVEFVNYNKLAANFGIQFQENMRHDVINNQYEQGKIIFNQPNPIFANNRTVFIKQICTQKIKAPAKAIYTENNEVLLSYAKIGKGMVFAIGDPWFYNEYVDGRKIPAVYENYAAAEDLVKWLLKVSK